jgi:hypothetical protein
MSLLFGPTNSSGQAYLWAQKLRCEKNYQAFNFSTDFSIYGFNSDYIIPKEDTFKFVKQFDHVIIEYGQSLFGPQSLRNLKIDFYKLKSLKLKVSFMSHGSDIRIPSMHISKEPESIHKNVSPELNRILEASSYSLLEFIKNSGSKHFVSTPDLLFYDKSAIWTPTLSRYSCAAMTRSNYSSTGRRLIVAHAPTDPAFKGSRVILETLRGLATRGVIVLIEMTGTRSTREFESVLLRCDVLVDSLGLGFYGASGVETMASGRVLLSGITEELQELDHDWRKISINSEDLAEKIIRLADDIAYYSELQDAASNLFERYHSGAFAVNQFIKNI